MTETTVFYPARSSLDDKDIGYHRWPSINVKTDLTEQGKLEKSFLELNSSEFDSYLAVYHGSYNKNCQNRFSMRWVKDSFLVVISERCDAELIDAFSKILNLSPCIRYISPVDKKVTFEWDMDNPEKRYLNLAERFKDKPETSLEWLMESPVPELPSETD